MTKDIFALRREIMTWISAISRKYRNFGYFDSSEAVAFEGLFRSFLRLNIDDMRWMGAFGMEEPEDAVPVFTAFAKILEVLFNGEKKNSFDPVAGCLTLYSDEISDDSGLRSPTINTVAIYLRLKPAEGGWSGDGISWQEGPEAMQTALKHMVERVQELWIQGHIKTDSKFLYDYLLDSDEHDLWKRRVFLIRKWRSFKDSENKVKKSFGAWGHALWRLWNWLDFRRCRIESGDIVNWTA